MTYKYQQCPSCFELSTADGLVCPFCATDMQRVNYYPWRRFLARWVDLILIMLGWTLLMALVLGAMLPSYSESVAFQKSIQFFGHPLIAYPLMAALYILSEAGILSILGNTPGKKLYRIRLDYAGGIKPGFRVALRRTFMVWTVGMGFLAPVVNLYAFYMGHKRLSRTGVTLWDAEGDFQVSHQSWGFLYTVWVVVVSALLYLVMLGIAVENS